MEALGLPARGEHVRILNGRSDNHALNQIRHETIATPLRAPDGEWNIQEIATILKPFHHTHFHTGDSVRAHDVSVFTAFVRTAARNTPFWKNQSWWACIVMYLYDALQKLRTAMTDEPVASFSVVQKNFPVFDIYVSGTQDQADRFMSHVNAFLNRDVCLKDRNGWVRRATIPGTKQPNLLQFEDGVMKESYIVMGLAAQDSADDVSHMLSFDQHMPKVTLLIPKIPIHETLWKKHGRLGLGAACMQVGLGTRNVAVEFAKLVNSGRYIRHGQQNIFFYTPDFASKPVIGGEGSNSINTNASALTNQQLFESFFEQ